MKFDYQIGEKEFIKLKFFLVYRKPISILILIIALVLFIVNAKDNFFNNYGDFDLFSILFFIYCFIAIPIYWFFRFKKEYRSNKNLKVKVTTEITPDTITDISEEYNASVSWESVHHIHELKDWFLFYYSNINFGLIPKRVMTKEQISELRTIIITKKIKAKLKKD